MRTSCLLLLLLCGLSSVSPASDSSRQNASSVVNSFSSNGVGSSTIAEDDFFLHPPSDGADRDGWEAKRDRDAPCYTMHIFAMKRDSPRSDLTEPSGDWTCRRASKYGMRMVEESGKTPSR